MSMQMYFVVTSSELTDATSREIQRYVRACGGLILIVTRNGPLVALDDAAVASVQRHPLVRFLGGVQLNPHGLAADRLQRVFTENLTKQVELRPAGEAEPA
jgi:hypothetical protein